MATALIEPTRVSSLAVLDIAPIYDFSQIGGQAKFNNCRNPRDDIYDLLELLNSVPLHELKSRSDVKQWLTNNYRGTKELSNVSLFMVTIRFRITLIQNVSFNLRFHQWFL